jgi:hypothetical protein
MLIHFWNAINWKHTLSGYWHEHNSVAATFTSQLQDLDRQCPEAGNLLRVVAFFDPETIPLEMLITGANAIVEAQQPPTRSLLTTSLLSLIRSSIPRQNAIAHLQAHRLVTYHTTTQSPTFRIHDLIQLEDSQFSSEGNDTLSTTFPRCCPSFTGTLR